MLLVSHKLLPCNLFPYGKGIFIISFVLSLHQGSMGKMTVGDEITTINSIPVSKMTYEEICLLMQCLPTSVTLEIQKAASGEKRVVLLLYHLLWVPVCASAFLLSTLIQIKSPSSPNQASRYSLVPWWGEETYICVKCSELPFTVCPSCWHLLRSESFCKYLELT